MCGRFTLFSPADDVAGLFDLAEVPVLEPRYNVAPTQPVAAVRAGTSGREFLQLRWGLIPSWADDPAIGNRLINARSETVAEKPAFRSALRQRRCLVVADGFYEWQKCGPRKQPYHFRLATGRPFAFAGLWERWHGPDGKAVESCTVLTTTANERVRPVHERMPVILDPRDFAGWLDPRSRPDTLLPLLRPFPAEAMAACPVTSWVSDPRHEDPGCLTPLASDTCRVPLPGASTDQPEPITGQ